METLTAWLKKIPWATGTTKFYRKVCSQSPVKPEEISTIIPLGNPAPPGHVLPTYHMYYNYLHSGSGANAYSNKTTIYAPADMTVTRIMKMDNADHTPAYDSYRIDFALCKQVSGYFILIQTLNDKLADAIKPPYDRTQESDVGGSKISHNWFKKANVTLKAGEVIGSAGGNLGDPDGLDLAIIDNRSPKPLLANAKRWNDEEIHYVCSLDYYPKSLSEQLYNKLGDYYGKSVAQGQDRCGKVYQDVPGTAQGVWLSKTGNSEGDLWDVRGIAALVHGNFDPSLGMFSFGSKASQAGLATSYLSQFTPAQSGTVNLDFNLVKPGSQIYCYNTKPYNGNGQPATILLQLTDKKLTIGSGSNSSCGSGPWAFTKTIEYVR